MVYVQMRLMDVVLICSLIITSAHVIEVIWDLNVMVGDIDVQYRCVIYSCLCIEFLVLNGRKEHFFLSSITTGGAYSVPAHSIGNKQ